MKNKKKILIYALIFLLIVIIVYAANSYNVAENSNQWIDEHGACYKVTTGSTCGTSAAGIFVPTKTSQEWSDFRSNYPGGSCVTSLVDGDNDNDGYDSEVNCNTGDDCYDSNANAKPGQTSYFTSHRGDSSFDYNCDSTETHQYRETCEGGDGFGWQFGDPGCGNTGTWCQNIFCASCNSRTQGCK